MCVHIEIEKKVEYTLEAIFLCGHISYHSGMLCQKQVSRAGTSNYIPHMLWDLITCPCPWCLLLAQHSSGVVRQIQFTNKHDWCGIWTWLSLLGALLRKIVWIVLRFLYINKGKVSHKYCYKSMIIHLFHIFTKFKVINLIWPLHIWLCWN